MNTRDTAISRSAITKLLLATAVLLGLLGLFVVLAQDASAGGDLKVTVNSTANTDDGDCEGAPNDGSGNCTLHEAIDAVNAGDADIINFHPPVFSKEQPGVIDICDSEGEGELPAITRDIVIDSKNSGVILDGGSKDEDCGDPADWGLLADGFDNGFDFELNGGKNFEIRNSGSIGIFICGGSCDVGQSLGTIEITGVTIDNSHDEGIDISGSNLESLSITNSEISANEDAGIDVFINACADIDLDCKLTDSVIDISGNRIEGGVGGPCCSEDGVVITYDGRINEDIKVTVGVSQNEVINGTEHGVELAFLGCGSGGINVHVDENQEINGQDGDAVQVDIFADRCSKEAGGLVASGPLVVPGNTSDSFDVLVTVNRNGDLENDDNSQHGVDIDVRIGFEESDSSAIVEVNNNGRITGESDGVQIDTWICCGDDNSTDTSVNGNDEITGEGDDGISVHSFAGSSTAASVPAGVAGVNFDADDNTCTITVDGNNEIDGVGSETSHGTGVGLNCFAGALGTGGRGGESVAGGPASSGDRNVSTISVTNNNDIDGDRDGVDIEGLSGSINGEADNNTFTAIVSGNGEVTGDDDDGIDIDIGAGTDIEEGDDNFAEIIIEENQEVGGNGDHGMDLDIFAGGITDGSEDNATAITIVRNGDIEGSGESGDGINVDSSVCCDSANTSTITINNNTGEITGHDEDGIDIDTCCSVNIITIMDNEGNIRGGDGHGLELAICDAGLQTDFWTPGKFPGGAGRNGDEFRDCLKRDVTHLTVMNNSFSDSERDGINIQGGTFEDEDLEIKSVISNNVIEGNGNDGIDVDSGNGLNIGPGNEIFDNGTEDIDAGIEIDWWLAWDQWDNNKFPANHNTITQNSIHGNFGLGIDLTGWDADAGDLAPGEVGCDIFPPTAIAANDCIPFPDLQTQAGDKLIGTSCSECTVEIFWAVGGEGAEYIVSGEADADGDFSIELPCDLGDGDLTATATDKLKNTSEFSETIVTLGTSGCATDTPTPTDTPVPPTDTPVPPDPTDTPEPAKLCGDPNVDGSVNSIDATVILQLKAAMIDSLANESSADVNDSGSITSVDASLILQVTAGLIGEGALSCPA